MKNEIKVSVIVPIYNAEKYLRQCLDSLLRQSLDSIEIICVDDCSTDKSLQILEEYLQYDRHIHIVKNVINSGAGESRNIGMKMAHGEYLAFLDADDFFEPTFLELTYNKAEKENADILIFDYTRYDNQSSNTYECSVPLWYSKRVGKDGYISGANRKYMLNTIPSVPWNKLYRRVFVEGANIIFQPLLYMDDTYFCSMILFLAKKIVYMGIEYDGFVKHRVNTREQLSHNGWRDPLAAYKVLLESSSFLQNQGLLQIYQKSFFEHVMVYLILAFGELEGVAECHQKTLYDCLYTYGFEKIGLLNCKREDFFSDGGYEQWKIIRYNQYNRNNLTDFLNTRYTLQLFNELSQRKYRCVLYGFGKYGKSFFQQCENIGYTLVAIVDESPIKQGMRVESYEICSFDQVDINNIDAVIVTNPYFAKGVLKEVRNRKNSLRVIDVNSYCRCNVSFDECVY